MTYNVFGGTVSLTLSIYQHMLYQRRRFTTINQLRQAIVTEWSKLQRFIDHTIGQWRRRLEWVVPQQGEQIEHMT